MGSSLQRPGQLMELGIPMPSSSFSFSSSSSSSALPAGSNWRNPAFLPLARAK